MSREVSERMLGPELVENKAVSATLEVVNKSRSEVWSNEAGCE